MGIYVKRIFPDGTAAANGRLKEGDEIIEVNAVVLQGLSLGEAIKIFKQVRKGMVTLTVRTGLKGPSLAHDQGVSRSISSHLTSSQMEVTLYKEDGIGLGIGLCTRLQDSGVFIHTLSPGSVAYRDGRLRSGDQILKINATSTHNLTLSEAHTLLQHRKSGPIDLIISRHPEPLGKAALMTKECAMTGGGVGTLSPEQEERIANLLRVSRGSSVSPSPGPSGTVQGTDDCGSKAEHQHDTAEQVGEAARAHQNDTETEVQPIEGMMIRHDLVEWRSKLEVLVALFLIFVCCYVLIMG